MKLRSLIGLVALVLAACGKPSAPPAPANTLKPLADKILAQGVEGVIPVNVCIVLGVRVCNAPKVKSLYVMWGDQAKFAQVYLTSPENISLGIRHQEDATVFLTSESGLLLRGIHLDLQSIGRVMSPDEAGPMFESEKDFWLRWLADEEKKAAGH